MAQYRDIDAAQDMRSNLTQLSARVVIPLRIDNCDWLLEFVNHYFDRLGQVGVVGNDHSVVILVSESIQEAIPKTLTPSFPLSLGKGEGEDNESGGIPQAPARGGIPSGLPQELNFGIGSLKDILRQKSRC